MKKKLMKLSIISLTSFNLAIVPLVVIIHEYENFKSENNKDDDIAMLTQTVTATESEFLDSELFSNAATSTEILSNFENNDKIPKNSFTNDNSEDTKNITDGAPDMRFGGGLFFDIKNDEIGDNTYASANFISIKKEKIEDQLFFEDEIMVDDINASRTLNEDSGRVLNNSDINDWTRTGKQKWDFSKSKNENQSNFSNVSTSDDFSLTPDYVQGIESNIKNTFKALFNAELYNWYWKTWGNNYLPISVGSINQSNANLQRDALDKSKLTNAPKINLSLSWNQLVESDEELPIWAKALKSIGTTTVSTALGAIPGYGPAVGFVAGALLDFFLPNTYKTFESMKNSIGYFSKALDINFWIEFFDKYLGTPENGNGLINDFKDENNGNLPSTLTLNNFDFYIPYDTMKINSDFDWNTYIVKHVKEDTWYETKWNNGSTSQIDLSGLEVQLGANFTLSRHSTESVSELIAKLSQLEIGTGTASLSFPFDSSTSQNKSRIQNLLKSRFPEMSKIAYGLSFKGMLEAGKINVLEVYYRGIDQNTTLPFKVTES